MSQKHENYKETNIIKNLPRKKIYRQLTINKYLDKDTRVI